MISSYRCRAEELHAPVRGVAGGHRRRVEDRDRVPVVQTVAGVAHVEEGLVVVGGQLG